MSENIENDATVEDVKVEETVATEEVVPETTPEETEEVKVEEVEEAPVVEKTPVVEEPKVEPKVEVKPEVKPVAKTVIKDFVNNKDAVTIYTDRDVTVKDKTIKAGFAVVEIKEARHWLAIAGVRPATPEEVAKEFGK